MKGFVMSKQFKITIKKYFEIKGKNYKKTMIDHSILFDPLVDELPNSNKWLLIALIMIAGEHGNATVTLSERRVNELLKTKEGAENALLSLQQYQVLSYEKTASNKRNKEVIKEIKKEKIEEKKENDESEDSGLATASPEISLSLPKKEDPQKKKPKEKQEGKQIETPQDLLEAVGDDGIEKILSLYEEDHVNSEFPFMAQWLFEKKSKKKNYTLFVMNWLKRSKAEFEARTRTKIDYNASMRMR